MTLVAKNWDVFSYYMTLVMTPMMMISGVFFPVERLPGWLLGVAKALPLWHGVELVRPLVAGRWPSDPLVNVAVLIGYAVVAYSIAVRLARRRFSA